MVYVKSSDYLGPGVILGIFRITESSTKKLLMVTKEEKTTDSFGDGLWPSHHK